MVDEQKPMTDEQLAEIRQHAETASRVDFANSEARFVTRLYTRDVTPLLAEVERQRAEIHGWKQVVDEERRTREIAQERYGNVLGVKSRLELRIDELTEENATTLSIVAAVAASNPYGSWLPATNTPPGVVCRWCRERAQSPKECQHDHECTWMQARALIAAHSAQENKA